MLKSTVSNFLDQIVPMLNSDGTHNFQLTTRRLSRTISDGFTINAERNEITFSNFEGIQRLRESLFFALPPKFRGDKVWWLCLIYVHLVVHFMFLICIFS